MLLRSTHQQKQQQQQRPQNPLLLPYAAPTTPTTLAGGAPQPNFVPMDMTPEQFVKEQMHIQAKEMLGRQIPRNVPQEPMN